MSQTAQRRNPPKKLRFEASSVPRSLAKLFHKVTLSPSLTNFYDRFQPDRSLGQRGETEAERFLLRLGYVIVARSYQDKVGEIDLVAVDGDTIVFVEVKTRTSDYAGDPAEAVDKEKQRHLTQTGIGYLKWHRLTDCRCRFDVIAIIWPDETKRPEITHYKSAFEPTGNFQMF